MALKLLFIDVVGFSYHPGTPEEESLGGSQSAGIYLMRELVKRGHEIILANAAIEVKSAFGILHYNSNNLHGLIQWSDAVIFLNSVHPNNLHEMRQAFPNKNFILWMHHATDQEAALYLNDPQMIADYNAMVFVSQWQRQQYIQAYPAIIAKPLYVKRNAIAPYFENLFTPEEKILTHKVWPPVFIYASTPFRGLDRLLAVYHKLAPEFPDIQLQVFSSMQIYRTQDSYMQLYQWVLEQPGGQYFGSVTQPLLMQYMKQAMCLAYPNIFPETSCIAIMEAMATGCMIMTSNLGALPETCAGLAELLPVQADPVPHIAEFTDACRAWLKNIYELHASGALEPLLRQRVEYANTHYRWAIRAAEWETMLIELLQGKAQAGPCTLIGIGLDLCRVAPN